MKKNREIVYSDGSRGLGGDFPVAVIWCQETENTKDFVVDPIFNTRVYNNLFGRIMSLVEATTDAYKLEPVKDLFRKELSRWSSDVYDSAREIAQAEVKNGEYPVSTDNIYLR